jgi:hypothetical protein
MESPLLFSLGFDSDNLAMSVVMVDIKWHWLLALHFINPGLRWQVTFSVEIKYFQERQDVPFKKWKCWGWGQGGEMTQALYAHMNNKII